MLDREKRLGRTLYRRHGRQLKAWTSPAEDPKLLDAVWEALNVARDNKALVLARQGTIVNMNGLAEALCGRSFDAIHGRRITDLLEDISPAGTPDYWQTGLRTASGKP